MSDGAACLIEEDIGRLLTDKGLTLAVAESCTGGLVGGRITSVAGSSSYFVGGIISYSDEVKIGVLGVDADLLARLGAVSADVAKQMARGVRERLSADIGVSITGVAGPDGGTLEKPVGLVFVGMSAGDDELAQRFEFTGGREAVRNAAGDAALDIVRGWVETNQGENNG